MYKKLLFSVIIFSLFVLSSCSANNASQQETLKDYDISKITGPYALRFKEAYARATTNEQREVFVSGNITKEQMLSAQRRLDNCYQNKGASVMWDEYGYPSIKNPSKDMISEGGKEIVLNCDKGDHDIMRLYYDLRANPYNKDLYDESAKCLIKIGFAPKDLTGKELENFGTSSQPSWYNVSDPKVVQCSRAPGTILYNTKM